MQVLTASDFDHIWVILSGGKLEQIANLQQVESRRSFHEILGMCNVQPCSLPLLLSSVKDRLAQTAVHQTWQPKAVGCRLLLASNSRSCQVIVAPVDSEEGWYITSGRDRVLPQLPAGAWPGKVRPAAGRRRAPHGAVLPAVPGGRAGPHRSASVAACPGSHLPGHPPEPGYRCGLRGASHAADAPAAAVGSQPVRELPRPAAGADGLAGAEFIPP